jgi:aminopeptidase N
LDLQAQAMLPSATPDWSRLGIAACYILSLDLSNDASAFTGREKVYFTNRTAAPLEELVFRLYPNAPVIFGGKLEVVDARIDGKPARAEVFLKDRTGLRLKLAQPLAVGRSTQVDLNFQGQLPLSFTTNGGYGIFERSTLDQSQGYVAALADAYPILAQWKNGSWVESEVIGGGDAVVSAASLYQVQVQVPDGWKVAASGTQVAVHQQGGKTVFEFVTGPMREFMWVASPAFMLRQASVDGVTVQHWGLPGTEKGWDTALQIARDSITLYDRRFGAYPYHELDIVSLPLQYAAGVEYPGLVLIESGVYSAGNSGDLDLPVVIAHEIAHQWWYGVVGSDVLQDPFQDEGLATFSESLYEQEHHAPIYLGELTYYKNSVKVLENQSGSEPVDQPVSAFKGDDRAYSVVVYQKGALFFQAVRERLGDAAFFKTMQQYFSMNAYTTTSPKALLDAFRQGCGCNLEPLFREWGVGP